MAGNRRFRRTTSMTGITVDFELEPAGPQLGLQISPITGDPVLMGLGPGGLSAMVSPRYSRRSSSNCGETMAHFLRTCGFCQRRLAPGRDIYMYRGDTAFCSVECREQQMKHDEREGKRVTTTSSSIIKDDHRHRNYSETSTGNSDANNTQTFAAA